MWAPFNGIRVYGSLSFDIRNIQEYGVTGNAYEFAGDMAGKSSTGAACTLADCSTRTDQISLSNVIGSAGENATFMYVHDQVFTIYGNDISQEGGLYGLKVRCAGGQPSLSYCPEQIILKGYNVEYAVNNIDLEDFTWFRCVSCYMAGGQPTRHVLKAQLTNYSQGRDGAGGRHSDRQSDIRRSG